MHLVPESGLYRLKFGVVGDDFDPDHRNTILLDMNTLKHNRIVYSASENKVYLTLASATNGIWKLLVVLGVVALVVGLICA
mmetsp:Transcript_98057/g.211441  ORF Transcript_98057/g.211441 Transcript_98057/m.211441 type:complete len:81 (+) Transcript_98057:1284-1526(+)